MVILKTKLIDVVNLVLGTFFVSVAINVFFVPNKISTGGASGVGSILLVIDTFVIIANAIVFNSITTALYSIVALYISKQTTDIVFEGVNYTKAVNIITKNGEELAKNIRKNRKRSNYK